jgi:hypothetical protein
LTSTQQWNTYWSVAVAVAAVGKPQAMVAVVAVPVAC